MLNSIFDNQPETYHAMRQCWLETHRFQYLRDYIQAQRISPGATILEIGAGTGLQLTALARSFPQLKFIGVEPNPLYCDFGNRLVESQTIANAHIQCARAEDFKMDHTHSKPSLILSNDVLHHIDDWDLLLSNLKSQCSPKAYWLAIEPNPLNFYSCVCQMIRPGEKVFQRWKFLRKARSHGWQLLKLEHLFLWPPALKKTPPPWLQKMERTLEKIPFIGGGVVISLRQEKP